MSQDKTKHYHRQPGEPARWYARFHQFMLLGPERSLNRCYRQVSNECRIANGRPLLSPTAKCPQVWRTRAREYSWWDRAEAWDEEQSKLIRQKVKKTRTLAQEQALEALQVHLDLMRGQLKDPNGKFAIGQNSNQRRLAADSVLNRAGITYDPAQEQEDRSEIQIKEIWVHTPTQSDPEAQPQSHDSPDDIQEEPQER